MSHEYCIVHTEVQRLGIHVNSQLLEFLLYVLGKLTDIDLTEITAVDNRTARWNLTDQRIEAHTVLQGVVSRVGFCGCPADNL